MQVSPTLNQLFTKVWSNLCDAQQVVWTQTTERITISINNVTDLTY